MSKRYQIGLNWKLNPHNFSGLREILDGYNSFSSELESHDCTFFPPVVYMLSGEFLKNELKLNLQTGSQDVFWEKEGGFTAQISPTHLQDVGIKQVLVGHSEVRKINKVDNHIIRHKLSSALESGLTPWLCLGFEEENYPVQTNHSHLGQIHDFIHDVLLFDPELIRACKTKIWLCYEPIWAIGTGQVASNKQIQDAFKFIQKILLANYSLDEIKTHFGFIYGGSVNSKNITKLQKISDLDGFLIGGASLQIDEIKAILNSLTNK